ncbi:DNA cross-link repair protein SNM1 isoform X1 [Nymphaea colorata]|nr:DNA cross-link repair protein SNM1 isoform X1 [Nymphaea colorata]
MDDSSFISNELDENGFPSCLAEDDGEGGDSCEEVDGVGIVDGSDGKGESFAGSFYRSGTDCSSLLQKDPSLTDTRKSSGTRLVQADLFKMWGLKRAADSKAGASLINGTRGSDDRALQKNPKLRRVGEDIATSGNVAKRNCPFYKRIAGTPFTVDAFRYGKIEGCTGYFLSHFHHDHYGGLRKEWSHGPIYCTPITARLVKSCLAVDSIFICSLELDTEYTIEGIKVTMLEANHCPGAAMIYFRLLDGRCYLHTGDFRACRRMQSHPLLSSQHPSVLYLDTTYCDPKYRFPSREDVLHYTVEIAKSGLKKQPKTLIVVGAYSIGKENVYLAISEALSIQIYVNASRRRILQSYGWDELSKRLSSDGHETPLHVLPISMLSFERLKQYLDGYRQFASVLAFRPTGWTYSEKIGEQLDLIKPKSKGRITIYGVPYSEHSSYLELKEFVQFLQPEKIIPTVNVGNAATRDKMQKCFQDWMKS